MKWDTLDEETLLALAHRRRGRRPLDAPDPARRLFAGAPVRGLSVLAPDHAAPALRTAEEAGPLRHPASRPLLRGTEALRIHPDAEGARPLSDHHRDGALGRHPLGRRARQHAD